eukprot:gene34183-45843_t
MACGLPALVAIGYALTLGVFYPGVLTYDTKFVYQDIAKGVLGDWQSPVMTVLWGMIDPIAPGAASLFLLIATSYWLGFALLSYALVCRSSRLALLPPLLALTPPAFVLVGILWRDMLFATTWLVAATAVFAVGCRTRWRVPVQALALALCALGVLLRPNALVAAPVLAAYILWPARLSLTRSAILSSTTTCSVRRLLAHSASLGTPECPATTIEQASSWADCVKKLKTTDGKSRFGYAYGWHFQDVNVCRPFALAEPCKDGNCVSAQIERDVATLRDRHAPHAGAGAVDLDGRKRYRRQLRRSRQLLSVEAGRSRRFLSTGRGAARLLVAAGGAAARAVFDSMGFLEAAKDVEILSIDSEDDSNIAASMAGAAFAATLARHNIAVTTKHIDFNGEMIGGIINRR